MEIDIDAVVDELHSMRKIRFIHTVDPAGKATGYLPGVDRVNVPPLS